MKNTSKVNYGLYFIAINLALWSTISCKKHPGAVTPTQELVMTPYFTNNKLIRYEQQSVNSCLITSIYMLVHSMKGASTIVNQSETEYKFNGSPNKNDPNYKQLAIDNDLIYHQIYLKNTLGITPTTDPSYTYSDFKNTVNTLAGILKIGPFVLGANGHAILVIGIEKQSGTLIYVDPLREAKTTNWSCSIFTPFFLGISELYYPNTYATRPTLQTNPRRREKFPKTKIRWTK